MSDHKKSADDQSLRSRRDFLKTSLMVLGGSTVGMSAAYQFGKHDLEIRWDGGKVQPDQTLILSLDARDRELNAPVELEFFRIVGRKRTLLERKSSRLVGGKREFQLKLTYPHHDLVEGTYKYQVRSKIGNLMPQWITSPVLQYEIRKFWFLS